MYLAGKRLEIRSVEKGESACQRLRALSVAPRAGAPNGWFKPGDDL